MYSIFKDIDTAFNIKVVCNPFTQPKRTYKQAIQNGLGYRMGRQVNSELNDVARVHGGGWAKVYVLQRVPGDIFR